MKKGSRETNIGARTYPRLTTALRRRLLLAEDAGLDARSNLVAADLMEGEQFGDRVVDAVEAVFAAQKQPLLDPFEIVTHRGPSRPLDPLARLVRAVGDGNRGAEHGQ
jgi:hypothetical protein